MNNLPCDGCGLAASPEHITERVRRLELSTRYRPVHIGVLFVALAPPTRPEDDFYGPPESKEFFNSLLDALEISPSPDKAARAPDARAADEARLAEFQRRGYHLAYLSECPLPEGKEAAESVMARQSPTLIRRIRFNYRPKQIAILSREVAPLRDIFATKSIPAASASFLEIPRAGDLAAAGRFREALLILPHVSNAPV